VLLPFGDGLPPNRGGKGMAGSGHGVAPGRDSQRTRHGVSLQVHFYRQANAQSNHGFSVA
jgi:hypothetical protein